MTSVHHDAAFGDDERRAAAYRGDIFLTAPDAATQAFCGFARHLIEEAFDGLDPETAQDHVPVERYVEILADLKPRFIHHPRSKELLRAVLEQRGCDLEQTYVDVPRLRTSTSGGYLTSGIAYAWHPHRDTWYSAPLSQLNFWMAVYPIEAGNAMAFHPEYFATPVPNTSASYNYYEWNSKHRAAAASQVGGDDRPLPRPTGDLDLRDPLVFVTPVGGLIEFSGQHLHSSVPNHSGRTRFSIDFRTVHVGDIEAGRRAPDVDVACTGSSIRDFVRASDLAPMPERVVARFDDGTEARGDLVFGGGEAVRREA
ncbi:MAG TPA: hypothetical protein VIL48_03990 [Acidimicrobiales bacterium]